MTAEGKEMFSRRFLASPPFVGLSYAPTVCIIPDTPIRCLLKNDSRKRRAISCDLVDFCCQVIESQSNFNLQVSLV